MSPLSDHVLERLEAIGGEHGFSAESSTLAERYAVDGSVPQACVQPSSVEGVIEVVQLAAAEKLAIIPCGHGLQLGIGMPPSRYDIVLRICGLDQILAYDPDDLTVSVQAGISANALNQQLREKNQFLPVDSSVAQFGTIGGILATNSSGPLRHAYGTPRDFVLGMEFITGEGKRVKSGGRVVKNVAGYDMHKLMIGSLGTLGIMTSVNFKTFPLPPVQATFIATFPDAAGALALRQAIAQSPLQPRALEIISPQAAQFLKPPEPPEGAPRTVEEAIEGLRAETAARSQTERPPGALAVTMAIPFAGFSRMEWSVVIATGGNERVVERHRRELEALARAARATSFAEAEPEPEPWSRLDTNGCQHWRYISVFAELARQASPAAAIFKLSVLPGRFSTMLDRAEQIADRQGLPHAMLIRAAGVIYAALVPPQKDEATIGRLATASNEMFAAAESTGGRAMIESCPSELKRRVNVWGPPRQDFALMKKLKATFDPQNVLSPGRFVGGI